MGWTRRQLWSLWPAARGDVPRNLALLREWQRLPAAELAQLQQERLRKLLLHAHLSVDYYRRVLHDSGVISADGAVHLDRFGTLPLLSRRLNLWSSLA